MVCRILILLTLVCFVQAWTDKEIDDFKAFEKRNGLKYDDQPAEFERRMKIFHNNVKAIEALKKNKGYGGQYGINKFSAMTSEEFQQTLVPETFDFLEVNDKIPIVNLSHPLREKRQSLPSYFDYRSYGWVSAVRNQGSCGSCWAFATAALMETLYLRYDGAYFDGSEQCLTDCVYQNSGCSGGWVNYAIDYIRQYGIQTEAYYPYVQYKGTCKSTNSPRYYKIAYALLQSEADIAYYLYYYGPVAFYFRVPSAFQHYTGGIFDVSDCSNTVGLHEITIIGYSSSYWIVKNSWGTGWGDNGYVYYRRGKNLCGMQNQLILAYRA